MKDRITLLALTTGVALVNVFFPRPLVAQEGNSGQVFAPAPVASQNPPGFIDSLIGMLPMLVVCYFIFWFMVIRPQDAKNKKHKQLLDSLKRGDSVVTTGGLIGRVAGVDTDTLLVEIAPNVKVKIQKAHIAGLEKGDAKAEAA